MKKFILVLMVSIIPIFVYADTYEVEYVYVKQKLSRNSIVVDEWGDIVKPKYVLIPTKIEAGRYNVELIHIDDEIYQISGTDLFIKAEYCYNYLYMQEALLIIYDTYLDHSFGKVVFID